MTYPGTGKSLTYQQFFTTNSQRQNNFFPDFQENPRKCLFLLFFNLRKAIGLLPKIIARSCI